MITKAPRELMRWGTMKNWLMQNGLSRSEIERMLEKGVIKPILLRPGGRHWYNASQIAHDVLNGWEEPKSSEDEQTS